MHMLALRTTHIVAALFNLAFIYTTVHHWEYGFAVVQWVSTPLLVVTGMGLVHLKKKRLTPS